MSDYVCKDLDNGMKLCASRQRLNMEIEVQTGHDHEKIKDVPLDPQKYYDDCYGYEAKVDEAFDLIRNNGKWEIFANFFHKDLQKACKEAEQKLRTAIDDNAVKKAVRALEKRKAAFNKKEIQRCSKPILDKIMLGEPGEISKSVITDCSFKTVEFHFVRGSNNVGGKVAIASPETFHLQGHMYSDWSLKWQMNYYLRQAIDRFSRHEVGLDRCPYLPVWTNRKLDAHLGYVYRREVKLDGPRREGPGSVTDIMIIPSHNNQTFYFYSLRSLGLD